MEVNKCNVTYEVERCKRSAEDGGVETLKAEITAVAGG
jgi:hypothetical protein